MAQPAQDMSSTVLPSRNQGHFPRLPYGSLFGRSCPDGRSFEESEEELEGEGVVEERLQTNSGAKARG